MIKPNAALATPLNSSVTLLDLDVVVDDDGPEALSSILKSVSMARMTENTLVSASM